MSDDELKVVAGAAIRNLYKSGLLSLPISSPDLLARVIGCPLPHGLLPGSSPTPTFRFTDHLRFEAILESLATGWDQGAITVLRENGTVLVLDIDLHEDDSGSLGAAFLASRKRKRVVDEEADSATGADAESIADEKDPALYSILASLPKDQRDIYGLLQTPTAKSRLLAEKVILCVYDANNNQAHFLRFPVSLRSRIHPGLPPDNQGRLCEAPPAPVWYLIHLRLGPLPTVDTTAHGSVLGALFLS
jgi:hypothetical protein